MAAKASDSARSLPHLGKEPFEKNYASSRTGAANQNDQNPAREPDDHRTRNTVLEEWPIVGIRGFGRVPGLGPLTGVFLRSASADEHRCGYE